MEPDDEVLLVVGDVPPLDAGAQVVQPPQAAAFAAPLQTCMQHTYDASSTLQGAEERGERERFTSSDGEAPPVSFAVGFDVGN